MPKISYLAKAKKGKDDTEVTALQIEQKIADIEALLRGMIDEDNMLCADNGTKIVPLSPSNVVDMPLETRPVNHSMKFFGYGTVHAENITETLFEPAVEIINQNPKFAMLNGILDKEIFFDISVESASNMDDVIQAKTATVEIPTHMAPMTYRMLWDYIKDVNPFIGWQFLDGFSHLEEIIKNTEITSAEEFVQSVFYNGAYPDEYVSEIYYELPKKLGLFEVPSNVSVDTKQNTFSIFCKIGTNGNDGSWTGRVTPTLLCRVNP